MLRPAAALIVSGPIGEHTSARAALAAVDRGLARAGLEPSDRCPLPAGMSERAQELSAVADFDARLHRARMVVITAERLTAARLAGSLVFEIATRARQRGVPACAIALHSDLGAFEQRLLDLQAVVIAGDPRGLAGAASRLPALM